VTVGVGFPPGDGVVAPRTAGTAITTISASPTAPAIASAARDSGRFRNLLRCRLPGRRPGALITLSMVDLAAARRSATEQPDGARRIAQMGWLRGYDVRAFSGTSNVCREMRLHPTAACLGVVGLDRLQMSQIGRGIACPHAVAMVAVPGVNDGLAS